MTDPTITDNFILELDHDQCVKKIRLLSLIDVVTGKKEVPFQDIQALLQLKEDDLEEFIIDGMYRYA